MAHGTRTSKGDSALLFIPDISGFTRFVDESEISHSKHIVAELLELLIDADALGLSVSEVEGDAILFYRYGSAPTLREVIRQAEQMFIAFHQHLQKYERDRMCSCGACTSTGRLTLKIIVHFGMIESVNVKSFRRLFGRELIVVHRLLKNDIGSSEYVLLTHDFLVRQLDTPDSIRAEFDWVNLQPGVTVYDIVGQVAYGYFLLTPLRAHIPPLPERERPRMYANRLPIEPVHVHAPRAFAYTYLTDLTRRHRWMHRVRRVEMDHRLMRVGTAHRCFLPAMTLGITVSDSTLGANEVEYVESIEHMPFVPRANVFARLTSIGADAVRFSVEVSYELSWWGRWMGPWLRRVLIAQFTSNARLFKQEVERSFREQGVIQWE